MYFHVYSVCLVKTGKSSFLMLYIYLYTCACVHIYIYTYVYIKTEREHARHKAKYSSHDNIKLYIQLYIQFCIHKLYIYTHKNVVKYRSWHLSEHYFSSRLVLLPKIVQQIQPQKELHIISWECLDRSLHCASWLFKTLTSIQGSVLHCCPPWGLLQGYKNQLYLQSKYWIILLIWPSY